jgi:hypothetical protein
MKTALSGGGVDMNGVIGIVLKGCIILAIIRSYDVEMAIFGSRRFCDFVAEGGQYFAGQIGAAAFDQANEKLEFLIKNNPPSYIMDIEAALMKWFVWTLLQAVRAVLWIVMSWGYVGQGVCILIGPLFIPFALFEPLQWMFWNWLRTFLYFSFYPVISAAVTHVYATFLINFMVSGETTIAAMVGLLPFLLVCVYGLLKVPGLVGQLFSFGGGGSGGSALIKLVGK